MSEDKKAGITTRASVTQGHQPIVPPNGKKVKIVSVRRGKK